MKLNYTYEMEGDFFVGYLDDYPEHPTQGENLKDFEENLLDIYQMIRDGTLEVRKNIAIPRHREIKNKFVKIILDEIPTS